MERCPACRARLGAEPVCPRCGCEMGLVLRAEGDARRLAARAVVHLAAGRCDEARTLASRAFSLADEPLMRAVLRFVERTRERVESAE